MSHGADARVNHRFRSQAQDIYRSRNILAGSRGRRHTAAEWLNPASAPTSSCLNASRRSLQPVLSSWSFEQLVIDVLVGLGYGGSLADAGKMVGGGGDEGIDGINKEDRLGLDSIYVQAKRWQHTVGRPEIQRFAGAPQGQRARKGICITTSTFSADAIAYASNLQISIVLIDGRMLVDLMMDAHIGVTPSEEIKILKQDEDYFDGLEAN